MKTIKILLYRQFTKLSQVLDVLECENKFLWTQDDIFQVLNAHSPNKILTHKNNLHVHIKLIQQRLLMQNQTSNDYLLTGFFAKKSLHKKRRADIPKNSISTKLTELMTLQAQKINKLTWHHHLNKDSNQHENCEALTEKNCHPPTWSPLSHTPWLDVLPISITSFYLRLT